MAALRPTSLLRGAVALLALGALGAPLVTAPPARADQADGYKVSITYPAGGGTAEGPVIQAHGLVAPISNTPPWVDVMFAVDLSGSTNAPSGMDCNGDGQVTSGLAGDDLNADGVVGDVLDCEIGAVVALTADLRTHPGAADRMAVAVTGFGTQAIIARMMTPAMQQEEEAELGHPVDPYWVAPGATGKDRDVLPRVSTVASGLQRGRLTQYEPGLVGAGTDFRAALTRAMETFAERSGSAVLLLLSDGEATIDRATLDALAASGIRTRTFAIGAAAGACGPQTALARIAAAAGEECVEVADPAALTTRLVDSRPAGLDHVEVTLGSQTVTAEVDALGRWTAELTAARSGRQTLTATAIYADGSSTTDSSRFDVTGAATRYVALGDSYASGEGVEPYSEDDLSMAWGIVPASEDYLCHRSVAGWPTAVTLPGESASVRDLAGSGSTHQFVSAACSGARMVNLDTRQQQKPLPWSASKDDQDYLVPFQLDALTPDTDLVTVSIGGNDIGFTPIVTHCLTQLHCQDDGFVTRGDLSDLSLHDWASIRLALIGAELTGTYTAIADRTGPETAVVALTYPRLVADDPSTSWQLTCRPATLQNDERDWLRGAADTFAEIVQHRAAGAGVVVADVRDAFEGHLVCDGDAWLFAAQLHRETDLPDAGPVSAASFHPNQDGVAAYTQVVDAAVAEALSTAATAATTFGIGAYDALVDPATDTTGGLFDPRVVTDPEAVLAAYPTEVVDAVRRTVLDTVTVLAAVDAPCEAAGAGEDVPVLGRGFEPGASVDVVLRDGDGTTVAEARVTADEDGTARATLGVPAPVTTEGLREVRMDGPGEDGGSVVALAALAVSADPACAATGSGAAGPGDEPAPDGGSAGRDADRTSGPGDVRETPTDCVAGDGADGLGAGSGPMPTTSTSRFVDPATAPGVVLPGLLSSGARDGSVLRTDAGPEPLPGTTPDATAAPSSSLGATGPAIDRTQVADGAAPRPLLGWAAAVCTLAVALLALVAVLAHRRRSAADPR